jgi:peptidoglycan/LPS O-acetylase OafA/YrhL
MLLVFWAYEAFQWLVVRIAHVTLYSAPFSENNGLAFLLNLTLLNGVGLRALSFNVPAWSISTEFWTYLVYGLIVVTFADRQRFHSWLFAGIALGALAVLIFGNDHPSLTHNWAFFLPRCLFSFFLGALVHRSWAALGVARRAALRTRGGSGGLMWQVLSLIAAVLVVSYAGREAPGLEFAAPFVFAVQIAAFALFPNTALVRLLTRGPLLWLGTVSYSIYMVHMIVLFGIEAFLRYVLHAPTTPTGIAIDLRLGTAVLVLYVASVLGVAALTYRFIEAPGRQLGRVLLSPRRASPRVQTVP